MIARKWLVFTEKMKREEASCRKTEKETRDYFVRPAYEQSVCVCVCVRVCVCAYIHMLYIYSFLSVIYIYMYSFPIVLTKMDIICTNCVFSLIHKLCIIR